MTRHGTTLTISGGRRDVTTSVASRHVTLTPLMAGDYTGAF